MAETNESLFSRDYFGKRGSWTVSSSTTKRNLGSKRSSLDSQLTAMRLEELSTNPSSNLSFAIEESPLSPLLPIKEISETIPSFVTMSKNQHGSKFWQETIPTLPRSEYKSLLYSALPYLAGMVVDKYGNYLCQVMFKLASATERLDILTSIRNSLVDIAKDSRGTHALQTLIEKATMTEEENILENAFRLHVLELATHNCGTHVIQKMLTCLHEKCFIIVPITEHITELATDKLGLCVIKLCITHVNSHLLKERLEGAILGNLVELMKDSFGNYVVQHMIKEWDVNPSIYGIIGGKVADLAIHKFSSNVVERCIERADYLTFNDMLAELLDPEKLLMLMNCVFGYYVIKTTYKLANIQQKKRIKDGIDAALSVLNIKKLLRKWQDFIQQL